MLHGMTAGTMSLLRLMWRRDRLRVPVWVLGLTAFMVALVPVFQDLLLTGAGNAVFAMMMENPAMVALVGPVYGASNFHTGAAYANMMLVFCLIFVALMNIFFITRHTRQDEEENRLELVRSLPVGRLANLTAALLHTALSNALLAVLTTLGLYALRGTGMDFTGCLLYGLSLGVTGMVFSAITAVCCQLTANNRTATGMALGTMMGMYLLRAVGDIGPEALSLLSPMGLVLRTQVFVQNLWWPLPILLAEVVALCLLALWLNQRRDLGQGLIAAKPGRRHAAPMLNSPLGLALRLLRTSALAWGYAVFMLAGTYASVFGEMEGFIEGNAMLSAIFKVMPGISVTEQFISLLTAVMMMLAGIPVLGAVARVVSEERQGLAEHMMSRAVSRHQYLGGYLAVAVGMSLVYPALIALGFYTIGSLVYPQTPTLTTFLVACYSFVPALWVMLGLMCLVAAVLPRRVWLGYAALVYSFFAVYFGRLMNLPDWTSKLTPMGYVPSYPVEPLRAAPMLGLIAVAAALVAVSFLVYRKRDLQAL